MKCYIGQQFKDYCGADTTIVPGNWTLVAILQDNVVVLRYETVASESNWAGTEGKGTRFAIVEMTKPFDDVPTGRLTDGAGGVYVPL